MRGRVNQFSLTTILAALVTLICTPALMAWELPVVVAEKAGHTYYKPEVGFAPDGSVYIAYREKGAKLNSDIIVCHYDGTQMTYENVSEGQTFYANYGSYESDIEVTADGNVHVAWVLENKSNHSVHHIKYRMKNGKTWGPIIHLGDVHFSKVDDIIDLRLGVDNSGNVHVVLQEENSTVIHYVAKYGDTILNMERVGNAGSRLKHPDIAVDDNHVHMIWMRKVGFPYVIMHQKRENRIGGTKGAIRQITFPKGESASQKSRIDLDSEGYLHLAEFYKTGIIKKLKYYQELPNGQFTPYVNLSSPDRLMLYHWAGLEVRDNSRIASMQLGSSSGGDGIYYNWYKNGQWGGYTFLNGTAGAVHQSVDLNPDATVAAIAYGRFENAIMLSVSEPIVTESPLEAQFSTPNNVFWGDSVTFDASQCYTLNPDANIVEYRWDFGDGTNTVTAVPTVQHTFNTYGNSVMVQLTIVSAKGHEGSVTKEVEIDALYSAVVSSVQPRQIRTLLFSKPANYVSWKPNPKNDFNGYPDITRYEIYRAPVSSMLSENDYVKIREVSAGTTTILDYNGVKSDTQYVYAIVSVDSEGHKSPMSRQ